jgi:hypothetical protein
MLNHNYKECDGVLCWNYHPQEYNLRVNEFITKKQFWEQEHDYCW